MKRVSEPFAAGGMGSVHLAANGGDGRLYALKRLHPHLAHDDGYLAMLVEEAALAASIRHENVITTYGIDVFEGLPCVVMDYVPGLSVSDVIVQAHPTGGVPVPFALKIAADALRGLHAAHEAGIVHRDVSPQNILVGTDGLARVLDFGIAKAADSAPSTRAGEIKGKVAYVAPEQLMGAPADRRTDLRAIGIVLWEMLAGRPLFHGGREEDAVARILAGYLPRVGDLAPEIPYEVELLVERALALHPEDRFSSALEMAGAIEVILGQYWISAEDVGRWIQKLGGPLLEGRDRVGEDLRRRAAAVRTSRRPSLRTQLEKWRGPATAFFSAFLVGAGGGLLLRSLALAVL